MKKTGGRKKGTPNKGTERLSRLIDAFDADDNHRTQSDMANPFRPLTKMSVITRDEASVIPRAWTPSSPRRHRAHLL